MRERVVAGQRKPPRKASRKGDHETVVGAFIPWTKRPYRPGGKRRQKLPARRSRCKGDVCFAKAKQVVHLAMIVISFDDDVLNFLLHADADAGGERRLEGAIDVGRKQLCRNRRMRKRAERSPEEEA